MGKNEYRDDAENDVYGYEAFTEKDKNGLRNDDGTEAVDVEIVGVNFKKNGKIYYFNPAGESYVQGTNVVVETARGLEYGTVIIANRTVTSRDVTLPLRDVVRTATEADVSHYKENKEKEIDAYNVCVKKIAEHDLSMKLVDVEYTFDNTKLLFYFTADGRIDFRDLVKDLASVFKTRIELRQIGIRDEAKIIGGLGMCGRPFCCHSFLNDFVQVSIKMAKEQNLSLNSTKISGACGRLMCCLRYEYDVYEEEIRKTPKVDSCVITPDGEGVVIETMPLAGLVKVQLYGKQDTPPKVFHREDLKISADGRHSADRKDETSGSETKEANDSEAVEQKAKKHSGRPSKQVARAKGKDRMSDATEENSDDVKAADFGDSVTARDEEKQILKDSERGKSAEEKVGVQISHSKRRHKDFRQRKRGGGNKGEKNDRTDKNGKSDRADRTNKDRTEKSEK